jgi:hypothetical protein
MCEDESEVVVLATKILARLIAVHGSPYSKKLAEKSGGYIIMKHRLKRWWNVPTLWTVCFAILFGLDIAELGPDRGFDPAAFLDFLLSRPDAKVVFPEILPILTEMLHSGLNEAVAGDERLSGVKKGSDSPQTSVARNDSPSRPSSTPSGMYIQFHSGCSAHQHGILTGTQG